MPLWILENTLIATVFALVVALVCRLPRVAPVIRHALWVVVLIRLIMPPVFAVTVKEVSKPDDVGSVAAPSTE